MVLPDFETEVEACCWMLGGGRAREVAGAGVDKPKAASKSQKGERQKAWGSLSANTCGPGLATSLGASEGTQTGSILLRLSLATSPALGQVSSLSPPSDLSLLSSSGGGSNLSPCVS
ncbi:hypothetical protein RhiXN_10610 [Rhizoctonia solani]|uniref:Uncharacterized protein n=1 Tax=Rhizoctonia solani TaxID=456999 RepID=A0A8H8P214_9AGAM|nr:uncharacterized protein RhiXN_10610 [Rhizoctonia solani]QRW24286.1 hypothetical protein RhiXN_10610 [Rhizoctonia solani]